jgi:hypothetical protein
MLNRREFKLCNIICLLDDLIDNNQLVNDNAVLAAFTLVRQEKKYSNEKVIDALKLMKNQ